jgi:phosphatidylserine synthase
MIWTMAAKLFASIIGAALWVWVDGPSCVVAATVGVLPIWLESAATRLTGCEPSLEKRLLWKVVDNGIDAMSFVLLPVAWFASVTCLGWPAYVGLITFACCGIFRLIRFVRGGLLSEQFFEGLPVTYTGYAWIVLVILDRWEQTWIALALLLALSGAMVSTRIHIRRTQTRYDAP